MKGTMKNLIKNMLARIVGGLAILLVAALWFCVFIPGIFIVIGVLFWLVMHCGCINPR